MKLPAPYFLLITSSFFLLLSQCEQSELSSIESQKEELPMDLSDSVLANPDPGRLDYERCVRYAKEDYEICEKRARRSGFRIFGITLLLGIVYAVYARRASILFAALFLGFLFAAMNYGLESTYCKKVLERELGRCEEIWLQ